MPYLPDKWSPQTQNSQTCLHDLSIVNSLLRQPYGSAMHSILPDISGFCRCGSNIM